MAGRKGARRVRGKSLVRVFTFLPRELVETLDAAAAVAGSTRSLVVAELIKKGMKGE